MYVRNFIEFRALLDQLTLYVLIKHNLTFAETIGIFYPMIRNNNDLMLEHQFVSPIKSRDASELYTILK